MIILPPGIQRQITGPVSGVIGERGHQHRPGLGTLGADLFLILPGHFRSKAVIGHAAPGGGSGGAKGLVQSGHRPSYRSSVRRASSPSGMQGSGPLLRFCWVSQPLPASRTTAGRRAPRIACSTACSRLGTTVYAFP